MHKTEKYARSLLFSFPLFLLFSLLVNSFFISCANVGVVEGGPRDTTAPKVVYTLPENEKTHFKSKKFSLTFDEYLQPGGVANEISVSPPLNKKATASVRAKIIDVAWEDTLKENTTYSFRFGNGIKDLNEGNVLKNFIYVFSTGDYIDSLEVSGRITSLEDQSPVAEAIVGLYKWNGKIGDSTAILEKPYYYTTTDDQGKYQLQYLAAGDYRMVVFVDENGNFTYDPGLEEGGFWPDSINPLNVEEISLVLFPPKLRFRVLESAFTHPQAIRFILSRPSDGLKVALLPEERDISFQTKQSGDTLFLFMEEAITDSILVHLQTSEFEDTLKLRPRRNLKSDHFVRKAFGAQLHPRDTAHFFGRIPLREIDSSRISIIRDSIPIPLDSFSIQSGSRFFSLDFERREGDYKVLFYPHSLEWMDGKKLEDTLSFPFSILAKDEYGKLELTVSPEGNRLGIFELTDEKDKLILRDTLSKSRDYVLSNLPAGGYHMRFIVDWNKNGQWDTGNLLENRLPEPIIRNNESVQLKANWDIEYTWEIGLNLIDPEAANALAKEKKRKEEEEKRKKKEEESKEDRDTIKKED